MQNLEIIISMIATTIGFLISTITFIIKFIQTEKAKRAAESKIQLKDILHTFICEAECLSSFTGIQKKSYVMAKIAIFAQENGIAFDEEIISQKIDEFVALTKKVNFKN